MAGLVHRGMANLESRTLYSMFPNLDRDVIEDVIRLKQGRSVVVHTLLFDAESIDMLYRVGLAVDACLALTTGG